MKYRMMLTALSVFLLLSGCAASTTQPASTPSQMTQPIVTDNLTSSSESTSPSIDSSLSASPSLSDLASMTPEQAAERYYRLTAEEKALRIEIQNLEADFRVGKIDKSALIEQKATLVSQSEILDREADLLEDLFPPSLPEEGWINLEDPNKMIEQYFTLESQENAFEREMNRLELDYSNGSVDRETFLSKWAELEKQADVADDQKDYLEDLLESIGIDL